MRAFRSLRFLSAVAVWLLFLSAAVRAESAAELIVKGDIHYDKMQPAEALTFYLPAEKLDPKNARLLVRIARQYRHLMFEATKTEEKLRLGNLSTEYSRRAIRLAPNDPETHLALATTLGKVLPLLGNKERVENSRVIKESVERSLKLDPRNDIGWHVLGRWHVGIAEIGAVKRALAATVYGKLPPFSNEEAVRCFEKAIELNPSRLMHYIELGCTYANMGRNAEARQFISKGLAMPAIEKDDEVTKQKGRGILKKLR